MVQSFAEFHETMTLQLPDIRDRVQGVFGESTKTKSDSHGLVVELAAIHEGLTSNFNYYSADELEAALQSWVSPYPKPILINHNLEVNPLGRVMAARMDKEEDGTYYTRLQIAVTDPEAVARVADQRYLTGSVGGKSKEAMCSVCGKDWAEASAVSLPCKHVRGKTYKGRLAFLERRALEFKEYSFVNAPADSRSMIREPGAETTSEEWVRPARVFDLNMNKQEIVEFGESDNHNVLTELRRKEATPLYLQLKGAFLTALSAEAADLGLEESSDVATHEDDILALSEELSDDLANVVTEETDDEEEAIEPEAEGDDEDRDEEEAADEERGEDEDAEARDDAPEGEENAEAPESDDDEDDDEEAADGSEDSVDDDEDANDEQRESDADTYSLDKNNGVPAPKRNKNRPQGMEIPRAKNDSNTYGFSPMMGDAGTQRRGIETARKDPTRESDEAAQDLEESETTELNEAIGTLERRVAELEEREDALLEENTRLKKALHRTLAERVVDSKIALGLHDVTEREALLSEHVTRSAASLADNLRDLARMTFKRSVDPAALPAVEEKAIAVNDPNAVDAKIVTESAQDELDPENVFVDALMGRRKL